MTFAEVHEAIGLEEDVMKKVLHSLSCAKYKVLKKDPAVRPGVKPQNQINRGDKFKFNDSFETQMREPLGSAHATTRPLSHARFAQPLRPTLGSAGV